MLHTWSFIGPGPSLVSFHGCQGQNVSSHRITTDNFHDWLEKVHLGWMNRSKMAIQYHVLGGLRTMVKSWLVYFEHSQGIYCQMGDDTFNSWKRKQTSGPLLILWLAVEQMASCHEWKVVNLDFSKVSFSCHANHQNWKMVWTKLFQKKCSLNFIAIKALKWWQHPFENYFPSTASSLELQPSRV